MKLAANAVRCSGLHIEGVDMAGPPCWCRKITFLARGRSVGLVVVDLLDSAPSTWDKLSPASPNAPTRNTERRFQAFIFKLISGVPSSSGVPRMIVAINAKGKTLCCSSTPTGHLRRLHAANWRC